LSASHARQAWASMQGGYSTASQTVVSKELRRDGRLVSFVKINKTSLWLLKRCGGKAARKGLLQKFVSWSNYGLYVKATTK